MELTKLEKAIVFSIIVRSIGEQEIIKYIDQDASDQEMMDQLTIMFKDILYNTSLKTINDSTVNAINKIFQSLIEENKNNKEQDIPMNCNYSCNGFT